MKKKYMFILLIFSLIFSSCENYKIERRDIDKTMLISVIGIDIATDGKVVVTISPESVNTPDNASSIEGQSYVINSKGDTIFEAVRKISLASESSPFFGDIEHIIIGENAAKKDIIKYLDYFSRDHEFRLNINVFITKGSSAKEIIEQASNSNVNLSDYFKSLLLNVDTNSMSSKVQLFNLMTKFDNKFLSPYIPCIVIGNKNDITISEFSIRLNGYAILKDSKLIGYLTDKEARGLNWVIKKIKSGTFTIKDMNGDNIALEIIESNSKIVPKFTKDKLSILIKIRTSTNISEITGREDIFTRDYFSYLEKEQNNAIKSEIKSAIDFASKHNSDIFDINGTIFRKHPVKWKTLESKWQDIFPTLDIDVEVNSLINRSYEIKKTTDSRYKEGANY